MKNTLAIMMLLCQAQTRAFSFLRYASALALSHVLQMPMASREGYKSVAYALHLPLRLRLNRRTEVAPRVQSSAKGPASLEAIVPSSTLH